MAQSTIFPIYLRSEYKADGQAFARFQSEVQRNAAQAKRELAGVGAALDQALSRPRNNLGSLDLGVDELRRAAAQQQAVAAAARQVAEATRAAATANGGFEASMSRATRAAFQLANAEERKTRELFEQITALDAVQNELNKVAASTDIVTQATRRGMVARRGSAGSISAERAAFVGLGQQLQDITVQAQMGTSAFVIFGQQVPQMSFALMGLADSTNATKAAIGRTAAFLAGPWGAAVFAGVAVLGPFVAKLFEAGEAAETAKVGANSLATAQGVLGDMFDLASGKIASQNELLKLNARLTALNLRSEALAKGASARATFAAAGQRSTGDSFFGGGISDTAAARAGVAPRASRGQNNAATVRELLEGVRAGRISPDEALRRSDRLDFTGTGATKEAFQQAVIDQAFSKDAERVAALINESLDSGTLAPELRRDKKTRATRSAANKAAREAERLATFGENAAETIKRLNEAFDEQPRLVDRAAQATRELDKIIADLGQRKPAGFKELIADAEKAKATVESALVRPFEELRQESEQRLQIETLLAQGREDEAAALQEIFRLEQQLGTEAELRAEMQSLIKQGRTEEARQIEGVLANYELMRQEARDLAVAEQRRTREYQAQRELLELQADVARTVADDLRSLFSGRSTDFFGNFKQALLDLQGARLFEDLFGPAFRQLEEELRGNTPQGRANARYTATVNKTADITETLAEALAYLTDSVQFAGDRLRGIAANDNGMSEIVVRANAGDSKTEIARRSVVDIAKEIGNTVGTRFASVFEGVLGPRALQALGQTIGGFIAGKALGGTTGGILGGLQGLTANIKGLEGVSKTLGNLLEGAATGAQVNAIGEAIGIRGSKTGATIGGVGGRALGTIIGGPAGGKIGQLVGAVLGNVVGGLLKSPKRGSATIGGVGGSLGITGTVGNSSTLRDTANTLAGNVLNAVNDIARQLGATVDASRGSVSIGQRKDNLRVDPSGRGATKIGNGAINFGDDAEAAVAFAVQNLIQDGVITGLRAAESRLLQAGKDINAAVRDVLTFRSVFDRLKEIKDPIGAALDAVNREFDQFRELFARAGADAADLAALEELYGLERARAIEDATDRVVGSLKSLLQDLRIGDNGLSLRTRRNNALGDFNALAARVAAGDASAFDDFAEISKQLLDIERQLFGSTQSYFDRLAQVTGLTEQAIAGQTNVTSIAAAAIAPSDDRTAVVRSVDRQTEQVVGRLDVLNSNFIALASRLDRVAGGYNDWRGEALIAAQVANF